MSVPGDLRELSARRIIGFIADAAARFRNADYAPRVRVTKALMARTGYSEPAIDFALDEVFSQLTRERLIEVVAREFGSLEVLDGFGATSHGGRIYAMPVGTVAVIASRTTIGVALPAAVYALITKNRVLVKDREDHLVRAFFATLAEEHAVFSEHAHAHVWLGSSASHYDRADFPRDSLLREDSTLLSETDVTPPSAPSRGSISTLIPNVSDPQHSLPPSYSNFGTVVAFGSAQALTEIRATLSAETRFIAFGPRLSVGYIGQTTLADAGKLAQCLTGAARDAVIYDGEGCYSLQLLFINETDVERLKILAKSLLTSMEHALIEFPVGDACDTAAAIGSTITVEPKSRIAKIRDRPHLSVRVISDLSFAAAQGRGEILVGASVAVAIGSEFPPPLMPRIVRIVGVAGYAGSQAYLQRYALRPAAIALDVESVEESDIRAAAQTFGATRVARFGDLQRPDLRDPHGGRPRLLDFVQLVSQDS